MVPGTNGRGGDGGGLQIAGEDGKGRNHGIGGEFFSVDNLGVGGYTQAGRTAFNQFDGGSPGGGKLGGCTLLENIGTFKEKHHVRTWGMLDFIVQEELSTIKLQF